MWELAFTVFHFTVKFPTVVEPSLQLFFGWKRILMTAHPHENERTLNLYIMTQA